jgi:AcrR family transcriptional regulator
MPGRQEGRSEETRQAILTAAGQLFATRGFNAVTMREIAREAGCSHTTIYIYFTDKEALLHQLSVGPLQSLQKEMEAVLADAARSPDDRLLQLSRTFIRFCLQHRTMYKLFFMTRATRVDEADPATEVNRVRNHMFGLLRQGIAGGLPPSVSDDRVLAYARICFFTLHGIIGTYTDSEEPFDELMARLAPTFDLTMAVLLAGFKQTVDWGMSSDAG